MLLVEVALVLLLTLLLVVSLEVAVMEVEADDPVTVVKDVLRLTFALATPVNCDGRAMQYGDPHASHCTWYNTVVVVLGDGG